MSFLLSSLFHSKFHTWARGRISPDDKNLFENRRKKSISKLNKKHELRWDLLRGLAFSLPSSCWHLSLVLILPRLAKAVLKILKNTENAENTDKYWKLLKFTEKCWKILSFPLPASQPASFSYYPDSPTLLILITSSPCQNLIFTQKSKLVNPPRVWWLLKSHISCIICFTKYFLSWTMSNIVNALSMSNIFSVSSTSLNVICNRQL